MPRLLPLLLLVLPSLAFALPPLEDTTLYSQTARDCQDVDLTTWQHPTRALLEKNHFALDRIQLCNGGHYPIFHVQAPYDPRGQTKDFFLPLYERMRKANGKWPYALVDSSDAVVVYVSYPKEDRIALDYEGYALP
ncbi:MULTISPECIES: hypothetical protein [Pseudomonas]|jgi:hypothetical protein|uniref:Secreted protein n=2 Tax=Pseudomonas TaxID=286 RepID=A0A4Y9TQ60_PSEFL|nr:MULTISPECIES: hypothetical protein [Pseudomonas]CRM92453.1 hypothetical protein [Pseudomonas sp. 22 E 5]MCX9149485.1 hypothetical protein [Pseudomonas sp. TB1-B1]QXH65808.1 hypothetical protein KSS96_19625 [Pseudomonas asgharzadehiana]TFW45112.1 hypothetical protein E4T65_01265 [Pseudomonas fluorescens]TKJ65755.1 hypothetical protein PspCFBP13506_02960 [Pseudomonas sp. CFBP13506]